MQPVKNAEKATVEARVKVLSQSGVARDGNDVTIYVDDEKAIQGQPGGTGDRKNIIFGAGSTAGTSEHYWDYVVFTTAGAFSPKELPNFLSMQAVESRGKVATCWGTLKHQSQFP